MLDIPLNEMLAKIFSVKVYEIKMIRFESRVGLLLWKNSAPKLPKK